MGSGAMAGQLIPPPELDSRSQKLLTMEQRIAAWFELCELGEAFWLAGIQRRMGSEGELRSEVRRAYAKERQEHDRKMLHLLNEFNRREAGHAD
jgi:hypothetical protein